MQNIFALYGSGIIGFYSLLFVFTALLYLAGPASRKRMGMTVSLALASIAGLLAVRFSGGAAAGGLVKLTAVTARLLAVIAAVNVAGVFVFSLVLPRVKIRISLFVEDFILTGAYVVAGLAVISASGANLSGVLATSAVVTGVVAFSLQDTLGNIIGGMVLHLENSFMPGDWIEVDVHRGVVREIRWRQTTIETLNGDHVVIPNIILMKSPVTVLGGALGSKRFRAVPFNVYYDRAPGEIISAVEAALRRDLPPNVAGSPELCCAIKEFQPASVVYEVRYYLTDLSAPGSTDSGVLARVFYALSREGIRLSVPTRAVVVSEGAQDAAAKSARNELRRRLEALKGVEVLRVLNDAEREELSGKLKPAPFLSGELITRQGAAAHWLYMIYEGRAEVRLYSGGSGPYRVVKTLGPGDVLGEMSLFTGEPRSATAVALEDVNCYRLDREGFRDIMASRPEIAESIAAMLAERRLELDEVKVKMADENAARGLATEQQDLLSKIRDFFKLGN